MIYNASLVPVCIRFKCTYVYIIAFNVIVHIYFRNIRNYHLYAYYVRMLYSGQTYVHYVGKAMCVLYFYQHF